MCTMTSYFSFFLSVYAAVKPFVSIYYPPGTMGSTKTILGLFLMPGTQCPGTEELLKVVVEREPADEGHGLVDSEGESCTVTFCT